MASERTETVTVPDGGTYDGFLFVPDSGSGPGIVLIQEIFGVGPFMRAKATDLATLGYVVLCPDVFWRTERNVEHPHDDAGLQAAFGSMTRWAEEVPDETKAGDLLAALARLRSLPETDGHGCAVMGYCMGGRLAYEVAVHGEPDACVSYYGSGIGGRLDDAGQVTCRTLFHYGANDPFIPVDEVEAVQKAFADNPDVEVVVHDGASHAFENFEAPQSHDAEAAARSWELTTAFLAGVLR